MMSSVIVVLAEPPLVMLRFDYMNNLRSAPSSVEVVRSVRFKALGFSRISAHSLCLCAVRLLHVLKQANNVDEMPWRDDALLVEVMVEHLGGCALEQYKLQEMKTLVKREQAQAIALHVEEQRVEARL